MAEEEFPQETGRTAGQRGSLKQVNATLMAQTEVLRDTQTSILSTNNLLTKSLDGQLKAASMAKLKDLEKDREGGKFKAAAGGIGTAGSKVAGAAQSGLGSLQGMLGKIGSFLTPAALMALPGILGGVLLKRGIPALAVGLFADEIADFLLGADAEKEMRDQVSQAIQFGAAGSLLGKRFALIGAAAGFLIDDEVAAQLTEVGKSIGAMIGADISNIEDLKGLMVSIGTFIRENLKGGLEGINQLLNGDIKGFLGIGEEGGGNLVSTLGTLGTLGLLFAPSATFSVAGGLFKGSLRAIIGAISVIWRGVPAALGLLGLLGNSVVGAAGAGKAAGGIAAKGLGFAGTLGRMFAFTPAGAIVLAAGAGFAFTEWFKTTELGKDLMRMGEEGSEKLNEGVEGQEKKELAETSVTDAELGIVTRDVGKDEQNNALRQTYIRAMENSEPGSDIYELNKKALAKLDAKMVDPGLARAMPVPPSTANNIKESTMGNAPPGQPMVVDGSTNTVNNVQSSNPAIAMRTPTPTQYNSWESGSYQFSGVMPQ